jgi:hypothetical protein
MQAGLCSRVRLYHYHHATTAIAGASIITLTYIICLVPVSPQKVSAAHVWCLSKKYINVWIVGNGSGRRPQHGLTEL